MKRRRTHRPGRVTISAQRVCAWCRAEIPEDHEVFGFGAKAKPGIDLKAHQGGIIEVPFGAMGRRIPMIVPGPGSAAKQEGFDFYFMTCSEICAKQLRAAVKKEVNLGGVPSK
jgi:hypothetical protein